MTTKARELLRAIGPVAIAIAVAEFALSVGLATRFTGSGIEDVVRDAGVWAPLVYVALMAALVPLNVPGVLFVVPAATLFGTVNGILLALSGGFLASTIGVVGARTLARSAFEKRLPDWVRSWEQRVADRAFVTIALLRTFTFLMQPVDWLCGLSSVPTRTVLVATYLGLVPPTVVIALSGRGLIDLLS